MESFEIVHTTPSKIIIRSGQRTAIILGEALTKLPDQPDFAIYAGSLTNWQVGEHVEIITHPERNKILEEILKQLRQRGWKIEVEE